MPKRNPITQIKPTRAEILKRAKEQEAQNRAKNFPRAKRIYGHARAGRRAYQLFEAVAEYAAKYDGRVNMSRTVGTLKSEKYYPVYAITYAPTIWTVVERGMMEPLFQLGDEFGCRVHLAIKDKDAVVEFRDGGQNFKGN